jgi:hypothetical protein
MGTLDLEQRRILLEHLKAATTTPELCWFAMWEGFGGLENTVVPERLALPNRNYLLYSGPVDRALESPMDPVDQSPNLWWPEDRAWFVGTEIDFDSTFVGGHDRLIAALVTDDRARGSADRVERPGRMPRRTASTPP